ncbi:MAG: ComF family protein [Mesorhizobium sp.]|jgi:ComF family protein
MHVPHQERQSVVGLGRRAGAAFRAGAGLAGRWLLPPLCPGCSRQVAEPGTLCGSCWSTLRFFERPWCPVMGTPFEHDMGEGLVSLEAIAGSPPFGRARSAVAYGGIARQMVRRLKYGDRADLARWMAGWMVRAGDELIAEAELVVPVPLHWQRLVARRYNQSAELARAVAALTGRPFAPECARRIKRTRQQVGLGLREREANMRGAFQVPPGRARQVAGHHVLVVDDVYTTGATVGALTRALMAAGARSVDILTFARVIPGDFQGDEVATI